MPSKGPWGPHGGPRGMGPHGGGPWGGQGGPGAWASRTHGPQGPRAKKFRCVVFDILVLLGEFRDEIW